MDNATIKEILDYHSKWLRSQGGRQANLTNANLTNANLYNANLHYANLHYANLRYANLTNANLTNANLHYANLYNANLTNANLHYANLRYANLHYANLRYANLRYANLTNANLRYADLRRANIRHAIRGEYIIRRYPVMIFGLRWHVIIWDEHMEIGCESHSFSEWENFTEDEIAHMNGNARSFWGKNKKTLLNICRAR